MQGISFPLGLMNARHGRHEQRDKGKEREVQGEMRKEEKGSRAVEARRERERKGKKIKRKIKQQLLSKIVKINLSSGPGERGKCKMILSSSKFTTSQKQASLKFHHQGPK